VEPDDANDAEDTDVLFPSGIAPEAFAITELQFAASVPAAKLSVQFAMFAKSHVLFPEDIV
jgi:hypothetical protein